ncbi:MAG: protein translocase subunit SecD [Candidatus Coatesbacteria bacterium]|nr:protein translocase subunit SecD [Candidatus Coatesbacteria bacterium]
MAKIVKSEGVTDWASYYSASRLTWIVAALILALSVWTLYPSIKYYSMTEEQRDLMRTSDVQNEELLSLRKKKLSLGLDLQGGLRLVLELDKEKLKEQGRDPSKLGDELEKQLEVMRNRIDALGLMEPVIQKAGSDRIIVELPGVSEKERTTNVITKPAFLEFKLVAKPEEIQALIEEVDNLIKQSRKTVTETAKKDSSAKTDTTSKALNKAIEKDQKTDKLEYTLGDLLARQTEVDVSDTAKVSKLLSLQGVDKIFEKRQLVWHWGQTTTSEGGRRFRNLLILEAKRDANNKVIPLMEGGQIAGASIGRDRIGSYAVDFELTTSGSKQFGDITGRNIGRQLAIVLDGIVQSAPSVQSRITRRGQITGSFSYDEARDLAIVLRAGQLTVPMKIDSEEFVGPTLGKDAIRGGITAGIIGFVLVFIFMFWYYKVPGLIAMGCLIFNILITLMALAGFHATLTLPGIAGIILTIGMAVDANVIIFERMYEEKATNTGGKRSAFRSARYGFENAFQVIFDSNITTLIAALILYKFGTGPIRGFAITMGIGILASFFTAVYMSRATFAQLHSWGKEIAVE